MLEHYLIPIGPYFLLALQCVALLLLFYSLEREIHGLRARQPDPHAARPELRAIQIQLDDLRARARETEEKLEGAPQSVATKAAWNGNRRTQVIRLSRRGETAPNIAASLGIPRQEVELLLKVYGLALSSSASERAS